MERHSVGRPTSDFNMAIDHIDKPVPCSSLPLGDGPKLTWKPAAKRALLTAKFL